MLGVSGSLHCLLMCGPLACATFSVGTPAAERTRAMAAYQGGRLLSYAGMGALLGALGGSVANGLAVSTRPLLPWVMAAALVASSLELGKRLRPIPGIRHAASAIARFGAKFSSTARAGAIGAATPLLPCGLLYGVFAAALASGAAGTGALIMGAFAAGGAPSLLGAQLGAKWAGLRGGRVAFALQRGLPLLGAAVLVVRATVTKNHCH